MLWNERRPNQMIPLLFEILFSRHINMYSIMRQALHSIPTRCTVRLPMSTFTSHSANSPVVKLHWIAFSIQQMLQELGEARANKPLK